ncbi:MAG: tRNA pseudouridine(38-40) synthase TruA [Candidatus Omnitrophica bacterium]|nr:tRNA pseudouridine(38-40) synthase TruA [Candidatus Omnitrophota bacterium]MDD5592836.1 tRNA pseudouridine(38-40) synthase TruA [Candidatus Omnitrophota bacterium]
MRNIKLTIEYAGTKYAGWQVQGRRHRTIQGTLEKALQKILREKIHLIGSGRTDAGVHAFGQVANFKTDSGVPVWKIQKALNANLPGDIVITSVEDVNFDFHSRFDAKSKVYRYTVLNRAYPPAILKDKVYFYPYPLDVELMRKETKSLLGRHDFKSFCASSSSVKDTIRTIKNITIKKSAYSLQLTVYSLKKPSLITIEIEADGFLYNMVRNITGTLLEIGRGKLPAGSLKRILLAKNRRLAGPTAPAQGLCLLEVKY